jgi:hypothetical protein
VVSGSNSFPALWRGDEVSLAGLPVFASDMVFDKPHPPLIEIDEGI